MWSLKNWAFSVFVLSFSLLFLVACGGGGGTKTDTDMVGGDEILTDEDLVTDDLIPDEEEDTEPDETDHDIKDADKVETDAVDTDKVEAEPVDDGEVGDESEIEPDDDTVITGPCTPNPCTVIEHSDGNCTEESGDFVCDCLENYLWDAPMKECLPATQVVDCTNMPPEHGHWAAPNEDGKIEQTWDGDSWEPSADTCAWECDLNYDKQGDTCVAGVRRVTCENVIPEHAVYAGDNSDGMFAQVWDGDSWEPETFACAWECAENYSWNLDNEACEADTQQVPCTNIPENGHGIGVNADGTIVQMWDGDSWEPPADSCEWECDEHYLKNGALCEPETRREWCTNIPLEHAHGTGANADGKFEQVWDGDSWEPATFECEWECDENYSWDGAVCAADHRRTDCLNIPEHAHGINENADGKFEQVWDGDSWEPATFECEWECNENYTWNPDTEECEADARRVDCTNIPANAHGIGANADGKMGQVWDGDSWEPPADTCAWVCNKGYIPDETGETCVWQQVIYVNLNATGADNGYSWENAFTDLTPALEIAVPGQEIWVAAGIYVPSKCLTSAQETCAQRPRNRTFTLPSGVALYGGFSGIETDRDERDWATNTTILSGDFNDDDMWDDINEVWLNREENAYHVVQVVADMGMFEQDALLDGFIITHGYADDPIGIDNKGAGLHAADNEDSAEITIRNCLFTDNWAAGTYSGGGGAAFFNMDPTIEDSAFFQNTADFGGGALTAQNGTITLTNVRFEDNLSATRGGAITSNTANLVITDCTFTGNEAAAGGGAINTHQSDIFIINASFAGNRLTNTSDADGGAISSSYGGLEIHTSVFTSNTSAGGVSAVSANNATVLIDGSLFVQNHSTAGNDRARLIRINNDGYLFLTATEITENTGAGIAIQGASAIIETTTFRDNSAINAPAIQFEGTGSLLINRCRFEDNAANEPGSGFAGIGGAVFIHAMNGTPSGIVIENSVFNSNHANLWGGAIMAVMVSPNIINCTFDGNTASVDGDGIAFAGSNGFVDNTILWDEVIQITSAGPYNFPPSNPTFRSSDVYQSGGSSAWVLPFGTDGGGNIDTDPLFVGGSGPDPLALQAASPCVDAGGNGLVPAAMTTDILGNARIQNGTVDMGAYER